MHNHAPGRVSCLLSILPMTATCSFWGISQDFHVKVNRILDAYPVAERRVQIAPRHTVIGYAELAGQLKLNSMTPLP
jgi:hypothetical protein